MRPEGAHLWEAFRTGLRDQGYVEGRNLALEFRWAEGKFERLPALAAELIGLPADVLVVGATQAALAAKAATRTTPIVFVGLQDPVGKGLVANLARPGGNLTGLAWDVGPEMSAKSLQLVKEAVPGMSRVAVLWEVADPTNPFYRTFRAVMESAAHQLKLALHWVEIYRPEELAGALATIERARVDALVWCTNFSDQPVLDFAARHRLPVVGCARETVVAGALMSYAPSLSDLWRRAGVYIGKILKGARPADLPVEQPMTFEFVINLKTAKALGLTIPPAVLAQAAEVIQ